MSIKDCLVRLLLATLLLHAAPALAQDKEDESKKPKDVTDKQLTNVNTKAAEIDGLSISLKTGLVLALSNANNVLGQLDGSTYNFGLKVDGSSTYKRGKHEWRNVVALNTALAQTPALDTLIKSADTFVVDTTYLYFIRKWFGPFVRVSASMPILRGFDVRAEPTDYSIARVSGATDMVFGRRRLDLTDPFQPAVLKENAGPFARIWKSDPLVVETRVGLGGLQIFADKQLTLEDNPKTPVIEVRELRTVLQVGSELAVDFEGALFTKRVKYRAGAAALIPFWTNNESENQKSLIDLTNLDFGGSLSIAMLEWASLDYGFRAQRLPQLTDQWQIRHGVTITIGPSFERKPAKPGKPKPKLEPCAAEVPAEKADPASATPPQK